MQACDAHQLPASFAQVWPPGERAGHSEGTSPLISAMSEIQDDKAQYCIPFILERLEVHHRQHEGEENAPPFFLGLNGVQGAGKTALVTSSPPLAIYSNPLIPSGSL
jgi:hypothetical protein